MKFPSSSDPINKIDEAVVLLLILQYFSERLWNRLKALKKQSHTHKPSHREYSVTHWHVRSSRWICVCVGLCLDSSCITQHLPQSTKLFPLSHTPCLNSSAFSSILAFVCAIVSVTSPQGGMKARIWFSDCVKILRHSGSKSGVPNRSACVKWKH